MKDQRLNPSRMEMPSTSAAVTLYESPEPSLPLSATLVIRLPNMQTAGERTRKFLTIVHICEFGDVQEDWHGSKEGDAWN